MPANPMLQSVLLFQHHQTTTPYQPGPFSSGMMSTPAAPTKQPPPAKEKPKEPEEQENGDEEENQEEDDNGKEHQ